jgi:hypothetical protein
MHGWRNNNFHVNVCVLTVLFNFGQVLEASPPESEGTMSLLAFTANEGARNQKWGVQYYGGYTICITLNESFIK